MPEIGEIKRGQEIGKKDASLKYIWVACANCGNERWVELRSQNKYKHCLKCKGGYPTKKGDKAPNWKGGKAKTSDGYVLIRVQPDNFFYSMAQNNGCILEHRLVMAKHLNRCLLDWEIVHHKNGIKNDNRLDNLELLSLRGKHNTQLNKYILKLEKENVTLKEKIKQLESVGRCQI